MPISRSTFILCPKKKKKLHLSLQHSRVNIAGRFEEAIVQKDNILYKNGESKTSTFWSSTHHSCTFTYHLLCTSIMYCYLHTFFMCMFVCVHFCMCFYIYIYTHTINVSLRIYFCRNKKV